MDFLSKNPINYINKSFWNRSMVGIYPGETHMLTVPQRDTYGANMVFYDVFGDVTETEAIHRNYLFIASCKKVPKVSAVASRGEINLKILAETNLDKFRQESLILRKVELDKQQQQLHSEFARLR